MGPSAVEICQAEMNRRVLGRDSYSVKLVRVSGQIWGVLCYMREGYSLYNAAVK